MKTFDKIITILWYGFAALILITCSKNIDKACNIDIFNDITLAFLFGVIACRIAKIENNESDSDNNRSIQETH
jgi:uncharacterized membrane protein YjjP (DUF1212 family)